MMLNRKLLVDRYIECCLHGTCFISGEHLDFNSREYLYHPELGYEVPVHMKYVSL